MPAPVPVPIPQRHFSDAPGNLSNRHHLWYSSDTYEEGTQKKFRALPCMLTRIHAPAHRALHCMYPTPSKPSLDEMKWALDRHAQGRCSCDRPQKRRWVGLFDNQYVSYPELAELSCTGFWIDRVGFLLTLRHYGRPRPLYEPLGKKLLKFHQDGECLCWQAGVVGVLLATG